VTDAAIEVDDLTKTYPDGTVALAGLSFTVRQGEIFGLLGPNGSGKTTTVRILVTLLAKTSGIARITGLDVTRQPHQVRKKIGYAAQFIGLDDDLTARENLILSGRLHGMSKSQAGSRAAELLEILSLTATADDRVTRFSGGMRRRVDLAQALMHRPSVLFLDEPTVGMDPQSRGAFWRYLQQLRRDGTTVLLTTQYLEEADRSCDQIAIVDRGCRLTIGTPAALKDELGTQRITLTLDSRATDQPYRRAAEIVARGARVERVEQTEPLVLSVRDAAESLPPIIRQIEAAAANHLPPQRIRHARRCLPPLHRTPGTHRSAFRTGGQRRVHRGPRSAVHAMTTTTAILHLLRRNLVVIGRNRAALAFTILQPILWMALFSQNFRGLADFGLFRALGYARYLDFLIPGILVLTVSTPPHCPESARSPTSTPGSWTSSPSAPSHDQAFCSVEFWPM
jgi:ABC-2 type transport system ATP-binding protein